MGSQEITMATEITVMRRKKGSARKNKGSLAWRALFRGLRWRLKHLCVSQV